MPTPSLPDPKWGQPASICVSCGYSLAGLEPTGRCPECGSPFDGLQLVLYGVPNRSSNTSSARRALWALIVVATVAHFMTWPIQLFRYPYLFLLDSLILLGGFVAMFVTGQRERRGTERFIVTPGGIARVAANFDPAARRLDTIFIPWDPLDRVNIERISPAWKRIRIGRLSEGLYGKMRSITFDAGIRCPDADVEPIRETIQYHIATAAIHNRRRPA